MNGGKAARMLLWGQTIPAKRVGAGWECPSHAESIDGVGNGICPGGIGLQGLFDKEGTGGVECIAEVQKAGEFRDGVFGSDDDQLASGACREQLKMGKGRQYGTEPVGVREQGIVVYFVLADPAGFLIEGDVEDRGADRKDIAAVGEAELSGRENAKIAAPGFEGEELGG